MISPERSRLMSSIKGKDTKPELIVRRALHRLGLRYRLHSKQLPGHPDLVLPKYNSIILINGCFWHKHNCHLFNPKRKLPPSWEEKINSNVARDKKNIDIYIKEGWKVLVIWECTVSGKTRRPLKNLTDRILDWLQSDTSKYLEITGFEP